MLIPSHSFLQGHLKRSIEQLQKGKLSGKIARKRSIGGGTKTSGSPTKRTIKQPVEVSIAPVTPLFLA